MNIRFKSFLAYYSDDIGEMINSWLDSLNCPIDLINWKCCGGDDRIRVIISYYDYSEVKHDSV